MSEQIAKTPTYRIDEKRTIHFSADLAEYINSKALFNHMLSTGYHRMIVTRERNGNTTITFEWLD